LQTFITYSQIDILLLTYWMAFIHSLIAQRTTCMAPCQRSQVFTRLQGGPKILKLFCTPYGFIKYWPIFKLAFSLSELGEHL